MKAEDLSALQAPLKSWYQEHPEQALVTLRAEGDLGEGIACKADTGRALVNAGFPILDPVLRCHASSRRQRFSIKATG